VSYGREVVVSPRAKHAHAAFVTTFAVALSAVACGRHSQTTGGAAGDPTASVPLRSACSHAACGNDFFVDATSIGGCAVHGTCAVALAIVATGDYHINDEYPYKFKADAEPGVEFLGTDDGGQNVFSKPAKNWAKTGEKTGTMTVTFRPAERGSKVVAGILKLSVCSIKDCQLEQRQLKTAVEVL
jgi:hypothetical protein